MTRVLLVTGSRSLADDPAAERWARGLIRAALDGVGLLIVGDAPGPDAWAWDVAITAGTSARHRYYARSDSAGWIEVWDTHPLRYSSGQLRRWVTAAMLSVGTTRFPLLRNRAMVDECVWRGSGDAIVSVLALLDGLKIDTPARRATRGTEHTVRLALAAGLSVREEVWR